MTATTELNDHTTDMLFATAPEDDSVAADPVFRANFSNQRGARREASGWSASEQSHLAVDLEI